MSDADRNEPAGQALLAAYRDHTGPSPEAEARLLAALRRDTAAPSMSLAPCPPEHVSGDSQVVDLRARRRWLLGAGLLAAAAVVIAALALGGGMGERLAREDDPAAAFQRAPDTGGTATPRPTPPAPVVVPTLEPAPEPARDRGRARREPDPPPAPSLADEIQRMRPAQQALAADDPQQALALLADYAAEFPDGRLHEEYLALRAIARCRLGHAGAVDEADALLRARPQSMFAERVRNACPAP
jgi:hypothetical protein